LLKERLITAVLLALALLGVIFYAANNWFNFAIAIVVAIAAWEWANMSGLSAQWQRVLYALFIVVGIIGCAVYVGLFDAAQFAIDEVRNVMLAAGVFWAIALLWVQSYPGSSVIWGRTWSQALMGVFVLIPTWLAFVFLRSEPNGEWLIILLVGIVACADVGAYFFGRAFGKRKLSLAVSPGKSWEGFWGGFACCLVLALGLNFYYDSGGILIAIIAPVALISVLGDLLESMVKRNCGIKDSSNLLPGHGGIMDRVDSLTAAAPIFALALIVSGWKF
jgi:phosphatidate cytidylyltransferase